MTFPRLAKLTEKLDDALRFRDLHSHRTVGGLLDIRYGIRRHTLPALVLPALLCGILILAAPSLLRAAIAVIVAVAVFLILRRVMAYSDRKNWPLRRDLLIQIVAVLLTAGAVWIFGQDAYRPEGVYRHFFVGIAVALCFALLAASALVFTLFHRLCESSDYDQYLNATELFADRGPAPVVTEGTIVTALLMALFRAPLQLLTVPAMVALVMPPVWVQPATLGTGIAIFLALAFAGLNERFSVMWDLTQAVFFKGGSLIVSLVVIALGIGRLAGVSYVTTVFDAAAGSVIVVVLASAYVLSWWYDYWASRLLTDQILGLFQKGATGTASIPYDIDPAYTATHVPAQDRVLQIHGASRLIAICLNPPTTFFQSYTMTDLIDTVAISGAPGGRAVPTPIQVRGRIFNFHTLAGFVFVVLVAIPGLVIQRGVQMPELESKQSSTAGVALSSLLFDDSRNRDGRPVIVVAASGGGTRAALYTASVLEGIAKLGKSGDVVIGSGVSGGGAALAYFAANRPRLTQSGVDDWQIYFDKMKQPFIQDVLQQALEWRMIGGGRLGQLLDQSFKSRWGLNASRAHLTDIHDFGLILNTSLAGHLDLPAGVSSNQPLREIEPKYRKDRTSSDLAGGRLILTNLDLPKELAGKPLEPDVSHELPVIVRGDDVRLETAAALNANFPPVFPNAAIDVDNQTRYWVTDGGAVDNRGIEMLLYSLRLALTGRKASELPPLYIIVADASGLSDHFSQDRGFSSAVGGGSHFASHLDSELERSIARIYESCPERLHFVYLMMPDRLRASDSFGTHWMLQSRIQVHHGTDRRTIDGEEMIQVLRALHSPGADVGLTAAGCQVLMWSREDPWLAAWNQVVQSFGGTNPRPTCSPK